MSLSENNYKLGIDIGSTTAKIVVFSPEGEIVFNKYGKHNTYVYQALIAALKEAFGKPDKIRSGGYRGYQRRKPEIP